MKPPVLVIDAAQYSANYNYCLLDALAARGEHVVYATTEYPYGPLPDPPGVTMLRCFFLLARAAARVTASPQIRRLLRGAEYPLDWLFLFTYILVRRIRVIHLMWAVFPALDRRFMQALQWMGCRVILTAHNPFPHEPGPRDVEDYCALYHRADHVIGLTRFTRDAIASRCGVAPESISVIPHGDYGSLFAHYGLNETLAGDVLAKAQGRRIIAFLGQIRPYKGLRVFVDAFPFIRERMPDAFFLVAGSAHIGDRNDWEREFDAAGADDVWHDIRYLAVEDLKAYLAVTDVLVQPYLEASQSGNTVMAYAEGIPVISTSVGGLGEMTDDGETGFVVPPGDPPAIADAVARCFAADRYEAMAANARRAAAGPYHWSAIAEATAAVYERERAVPAARGKDAS